MDVPDEYDGPGKNGKLGAYLEQLRQAIIDRTPTDGTNSVIAEDPGNGFRVEVSVQDPTDLGLATYDADVCDGDEVVTKTFYVAA